jgi:hypothetical protein
MQFNLNGYLDPGIHNAELPDIEEHLVKGFPTSITRPRIIEGYKQHRAELQALNIEFEQFVDGSFVSTKNDPSDIDLVCFADAQAVDRLSSEDQQKLRALVLGQETKKTHYCDAYFCPTVPEHHPDYAKVRSNRKYWMGEFGFDRQDRPKGIVRTILTIKTGDEL